MNNVFKNDWSSKSETASVFLALVGWLLVAPFGATAQSSCSDACDESRLAGLIITTIEQDASWPGSTPAKLRECLHYPADQPVPNDDQVVFDFTFKADPLAQLVLMGIYGLLPSQAVTTIFDTPTGGGELGVGAGCSEVELDEVKRWLTLASLKRSTNPQPDNAMNRTAFERFRSDLNYRLINEYGVRALIVECKLKMAHATRRSSLIGPTPLEFETPVMYKFTQITAAGSTSFIGPLGVVPRTRFLRGTADASDRDDDITRTPTSISHRTAGRISPLLEPFERALLEKRAPPFASELTFSVQGTALVQSDWVSQVVHSGSPNCTWPTATVYRWDDESGKYVRDHRHVQEQSPYVCFIDFGTQWPQ